MTSVPSPSAAPAKLPDAVMASARGGRHDAASGQAFGGVLSDFSRQNGEPMPGQNAPPPRAPAGTAPTPPTDVAAPPAAALAAATDWVALMGASPTKADVPGPPPANLPAKPDDAPVATPDPSALLAVLLPVAAAPAPPPPSPDVGVRVENSVPERVARPAPDAPSTPDVPRQPAPAPDFSKVAEAVAGKASSTADPAPTPPADHRQATSPGLQGGAERLARDPHPAAIPVQAKDARIPNAAPPQQPGDPTGTVTSDKAMAAAATPAPAQAQPAEPQPAVAAETRATSAAAAEAPPPPPRAASPRTTSAAPRAERRDAPAAATVANNAALEAASARPEIAPSRPAASAPPDVPTQTVADAETAAPARRPAARPDGASAIEAALAKAGAVKAAASSEAPALPADPLSPMRQVTNAVVQAVLDRAEGVTASSGAAASVPQATGPGPAPRSMTIELSPADLGTVSVRMRLVGDKLQLHVDVEKRETLALIDRDRAVLSKALQENGYGLDTLTVRAADTVLPQAQTGGQGAPTNSSDQSGSNAQAGSFASAQDSARQGGDAPAQNRRDGASPQQNRDQNETAQSRASRRDLYL